MDKDMIEYLHKSGKMKDKYYYQQNGRTAQQNYDEQRERLKEQYSAPIVIDKEQAEKALKETVESALADLIKGLNLD